MKQIVPIVLTALMLTSVFAGIDFADELKDTNEMETSGRADFELKLHDVLQPRETFVDQAGNTRNGIDIGDVVYFRPIIINDGDNAHDEFNVRVTVTPAGDGQQAIIDNLDDVVCPGDVAVTGCSYNTLASGDFLGGGNYRIQAESGGDLAWTPTVPGEYTVTVEIDGYGDKDTDLTNNDMSYTVVVQHYRDIVVDLCWTDGPGGECLADDAADDPKQGAGPHNFALSVTADGSEDWAPRSTTMSVNFGGDIEATQTCIDDGTGNGCIGGASHSIVVGETANVDVWHNVSEAAQTVTDPNDINANPCANADNPCNQARTVMVYQTTYTFHGVIMGDETAGGSDGPASFSVSASLTTFDLYSADTGADGGMGPGGEESEPSTIMSEAPTDYDDRTGNNDGQLDGYFSVFHDVGITSLTGGMNDATEGTLNVGTTRLTANVVYGGSSATNAYDWAVTFSVTDENGQSAIMGDGVSNSCLDETSDSYDHMLLSETAANSLPQGVACLDVDLQPGRYDVSATVQLIDPTTTDEEPTNDCGVGSNEPCFEDMNSGNNVRATFFEVINDNPTLFMTLDSIDRDGESVDAPIIVGDFITMRARGLDTETDDEQLMYAWSRVTSDGEALDIFECASDICTVETDMSWSGERVVTATVSDAHGGSATEGLEISVWNHYSHDMTVTGASISYALVYGPMIEFNVSAVDGAAYEDQQLGSNAGAFTSIVSFDMTSTYGFSPNDMGAESMTIDFEGDATQPWGLWYKRTATSSWTSVNHVTTTAGSAGGVSMTFSHDGGMEGNLGSGTYAIFDVATSAGNPPATGVTDITADLQPGAQVIISWDYEDDSLLSGSDTVNLYWCAGENCDAKGGNPMPAMQPTEKQWTLVGTDAEVYTVLVQTENGNTDANGMALTGGSASITVTADGSVTPAPTLSNMAADTTSTGDGLSFTWDATDTGDVSSWVLCWAGTQSIVDDEFDSLLGNSCAETTDTTTSITVTEQEMCGGTCNSDMYFGMAGKDATGNVADPGALLYSNMKDGLEIPEPVDPDSDPAGSDDGGIGNAMYAIIALVVVAVIAGAFILTRAPGGDGEDKEWDY